MLAADILTIVQQRPLGLLFDIDGTLSPIAPTPDDARLYPGVAALLEQARQHAHVAIVTGRAIADGARIVNVDGLTYIGTHGLEWSDGLPTTHAVQIIPEALPYKEPGQKLLDLAEQHLDTLPGVIVQRKTIGGTLHYRLAPDPEHTRAHIFELMTEPARQAHMRLGEGKLAVEILAPLDVNKGHALRRYVERFGLQGVLFAGDDRTDLNAVLEVPRLRQNGIKACSIAVQHQDTIPALLEHADHIVQGVERMVQLLGEIVQALPTTRVE